MITLAKELHREIALKNRFPLKKRGKLRTLIAAQTAELMKQDEEYAKSVTQAKQLFLKQSGPKPKVMMMLTGEDEVNIILFLEGEINIFPQPISIFDGFELIDSIGDLLHIPQKRRIVDSKLSAYNGFINKNPLSPADCHIYARAVNEWLYNEVDPEPKIYWQSKWYYVIADKLLKLIRA